MSKKFLLTLLMALGSINIWSSRINNRYVINVDGETRSDYLYVPANVLQNCPVIFSLPKNNHDEKSGYINFTSLADERGFIYVVPQTKNKTWNASGDISDENFVKDLHFLRKIIDKIKTVRFPNGNNVKVNSANLKIN